MTEEPSPVERRRAACQAVAQAPRLVRFAARYAGSLQDAEDAYQRAMEIALTSAPTVERRRFTAWLYTVLKHEALAASRARARESTGRDEDVAASFALEADRRSSPVAVAEWRERYYAVSDALEALSEAQRICLLLKSAGFTYEQIERETGYSRRKVERSILGGRARLHEWELAIDTGAACARLRPALELVGAGEGGAPDRRRVERHVRRCRTCRTLLANRYAVTEELAALVPVVLLGPELTGVPAPDPGHAIAVWDRIGAGMTVRAGQLAQAAAELPSLALNRAAVGAALVAVSGALGMPFIADAVQGDRGPAQTAAVAPPAGPPVSSADAITATPHDSGPDAERRARPSTPAHAAAAPAAPPASPHHASSAMPAASPEAAPVRSTPSSTAPTSQPTPRTASPRDPGQRLNLEFGP